MPEKDWLKWYEGQPVNMTFKIKHEDLIKLMKCKEIKVTAKGETFILKKYTGENKANNKVGRPKKRKTSKRKKVVKKK